MAGKGYGSAKARVLRLTRLDDCGVPVYGECSTLVSNGFIRVGATAEYEDGEEFIQKNAWGDLCINEKDSDRLKRYNLSLEFCQVHPDVADIAAGVAVLTDALDNTIGFQVGEDVSEANFALELWTKVTGGDNCAGGTALWHYWAFPRVKVGRVGDLSFEYGPLTLTIEAGTLAATADWADSPYAPSPVPVGAEVVAGTHMLYVQTDVPPPVPTEGCQSLAAPIATGATAGTPGTWTPPGSTPPASVAALQASAIVASPATAWTTGQYVQTGTAGAPGEAHWDGAAWAAGQAT